MFVKRLLTSLLLLSAFSFNRIHAQSPTAAASRFNIFVLGDLTLAPNETEGPIAVGGNLISNQYQINFDKKHGAFFVDGVSIGLAVRGGVKLNSGTLQINGQNYLKIGNGTPNAADLNNLKIWYKDNNNAESTIRITDVSGGWDSQPNIQLNANVNDFKPGRKVGDSYNPIFENIFGTGGDQIDIDGAFITLTKRSGHLKDLKDNLPILNQNGGVIDGAEMGPYSNPNKFDQNPRIRVNPNTINVLTVSAEVWNSINNINFDYIPSGPQLGTTDEQYAAGGGKFGLIINIVDFPTFCASRGGNSSIKFPNVGGLSDSQGSYVIYNFPDATKKMTITGSVIHGTIFTPQAELIKGNNGNINGQIIAKKFAHNGDEIHFWPFIPAVPEPAEKTISVSASSKCEKNAPWLDYSITPSNFDATGKTAKIEWINSDGKIVHEDTDMPLSGSVLFPGASIDLEGNGVAWPGFEKNGSKWEEVEDRWTSLRKDGATIRVTVDPWKIINIKYPASTGTCFTSPPPITLPVTLASFTAENNNCNAELKWVVTEATDFSHFVVERSTDARNFQSLARIDYNASQKEYRFSDSPFSGETAPAKHYYYRLQQVDTDESFDYSVIRSVDAGSCDARLSVDFYPNPTQDEVNVKSFSAVKKLEIVSLSGKQVYFATPVPNQIEFKINVQAFAQGLYIVNVVNGEGKHTSKLLKK
ncbi:choice-of-anchor A family protein [Dyadobacter aurulentus]|uniref:choice-of-anchor A family protein n=1 Tax=Dyadobacter sp. UC 10 TaxID=2605428 RepID=UPI0011F0C60D|nr:choice-of-anchor A family protein [Dyadobacter sp. UC 10]KAA0992529.1 choice-of-anchor A family protein [Dyadobacter sp. UC 10]